MTNRVLRWFRRWWKWRRWQMTVPDPPPPAVPPGEKRLIAEDDLPDPATAEPPDPIVDAPLRELPAPPVRMDPDSRRRPIPTPDLSGLMKRTMTKKSRKDLSAAMMGMCQLTGWRDTTLNPDLSNDAKIAIIAARFGKVAGSDDHEQLYGELMGLAAVTVGAAQGIARRDARDRKRRSRAARKAERKARRAKDKSG